MRADCHIHMVLDGEYWKAAIADHAKRVNDALCHSRLARYRQLGYTYLRDGGDRWGVGKRARELAPEFGIAYRTPLGNLCMAGHYGTFIGEKYADLREYTDLVKKARTEGADFIKIMISGLMDFDRFGVLTDTPLSPETIRELIRIAHEEGFSVMAHCNGARTAQAAAEGGVDSIEHGAYLDEEALKAMAENRVIWCPTLSTVANLRGTGRFNEDAVARILDSALENVTRYHALGGIIAPGSDAGAWQVFHGGETEYDILRTVLPDGAIDAGTRAVMERF